MHEFLTHIFVFLVFGGAGVLCWFATAGWITRPLGRGEIDAVIIQTLAVLIGLPVSFFLGGGMGLLVWVMTK